MTDDNYSSRIETLERQVYALTSLVIDLLAVTHDEAPEELEARLEQPGVRVTPNGVKPLSAASSRRRRSIVAAAGIDLED